jgi:LPS-assembly protein
MTLRNRFLITAAGLCHLILIPPLVTSQLPPVKTVAPAHESEPVKPTETPCARAAAAQKETGEVHTICAIEQEEQGALYKLHGAVEIYYGTYVLKADDATYNSDTKEVTATGHFALDGGPNDDHIRASHGTYNFELETGRFYDVTGTTGMRLRANRVILTSTSPFAFTGGLVEKTSPDHYLVYDGSITTCEVPHPMWQFGARKISVEVGGNAKIYRSAFLLHGIPILWFPFVTHPVEKQARESGFLMPSVAHSSAYGYTIGDAYYWAINRMMDATLGAEYYSLRGWSQRGELRTRPSETSFVDLNYFGVIDRGIGTPPVKEGGENVRLNSAGNFKGYRAVTSIDYLSSFLFRLAFNEIFSQAVFSEVKSQAFLSKSERGFNFNGFVERYQNFLSTTPGQVITILHAPSFDSSSVDQRLWRLPLYWSFDTSGTGLSRSEPQVCSTSSAGLQSCTPAFRTSTLVGRFNLNPGISTPLLFRGWSVRPELTLHEAYYSQRLVGEVGNNPGQAVSDPINRQALETAVELRPPDLERVFDKEFLGRKWKHVIEPFATYRFVTGVNNFSNILKFDERDILSDTHEVEYGFVTRLYAKSTSAKPENCSDIMTPLIAGGPAPESIIPWQHPSILQNTPCGAQPSVRELVTWEFAQKYFLDPTFGGALVPGQRNVFTTTEDLTGIAFLTQPRHLSPLISRLRVETSVRTDAEWDLDYDFQNTRVNASTVLANYHFGQVTIGGGDALLEIPVQTGFASSNSATPEHFNQFRAALGYGRLVKRGFSAAGSFGFDADLRQLQFVSVQTTYNWDCCGVTLEYRTYTVANVRNENLFRFSFTLANIGGIGSLRPQERLY